MESELYFCCSLTDWFEYCMQIYTETRSNGKKKITHISMIVSFRSIMALAPWYSAMIVSCLMIAMFHGLQCSKTIESIIGGDTDVDNANASNHCAVRFEALKNRLLNQDLTQCSSQHLPEFHRTIMIILKYLIQTQGYSEYQICNDLQRGVIEWCYN